MLDAEWSVEEVADVTLVEVTIHNPTAVDRHVRVEDRLDGPTLPPRSDGVPERGWDADGYDGVVPAGERLRLGYASPSPPAEPPVSVEDEGRAEAAGRDGPADATEAMRLLDDASPPVDALPATAGDDGERDGTSDVAVETAETAGNANSQADDGGRTDGTARAAEIGEARNGHGAGQGDAGTAASGAETGDRTGTRESEPTDGRADSGGSTSGRADARDADQTTRDPPAPAAEWFADVERRVDHAERLTGASVVEAAVVVDERGGLSGVESLSERVADDEAALRAVAERAAALAERAAATDVPLSALRRLS